MKCRNCHKPIVQIDNPNHQWITGGSPLERGFAYCENAVVGYTKVTKGTKHEPETKEDNIQKLLHKIDNG